jgi:flagellar protein FliO/FliZ
VLELTVRLVVSLAVVVGLMMLLARLGARRFKGGASAVVRVVHRQPLSRGSAVAVVTVGSRVLVLGTTEQQVSVLAELDPDELGADELATTSYGASEEEVLELPPGAPSLVPATAPAPRTKRPAGAHRTTTPAPTPASGTAPGPLAGSLLSAQTWRQALASARRAS